MMNNATTGQKDPSLGYQSRVAATDRTALSSLVSGLQADASTITEDLLTLIPRLSESVSCRLAELLIKGKLMTMRLAATFIARKDASTVLVIADYPNLWRETALRLAKSGSIIEARALAARHDLDDACLQALVHRHDPVIDHMLAETPIEGRGLPDAIVTLLARRAVFDPSLARSLQARPDLPAHLRAVFVGQMPPRERIALLASVEVKTLARPMAVDTVSLTAIGAALDEGDHTSVNLLLATALGLSTHSLARFTREPSGTILALALKAIGAPAAMIRNASSSASSTKAGQPGGVEDIIETVTPQAARFVMNAIADLMAEKPMTDMQEPVQLRESAQQDVRRIA
jgi:hypothetical protein